MTGARRSLALRLAEKIDRRSPDECWPWTACLGRNGYGKIGRGRAAEGTESATRALWRLVHGPIPAGYFVCHHCDNRACCNLRHLFLGTNQDNMDDMIAKGRHLPNRPRGEAHPSARLNAAKVAEIRYRLGVRR